MMKINKIEFIVGCFMLAGILAGVLLSLKVAGLTLDDGRGSYTLFARFDNVGGLKVRSPIKIGGVVVGRVTDIRIDAKTLAPVVEMQIQDQYASLSSTTTASILTSGLLGEQYIGLTPGFSDEERAKFTELLAAGFTDSFRYLYPDRRDAYSWWSYRAAARERNVGWRIDYFVVSDRLRGNIKDAYILPEITGSDHCPVGLDMSW